MQMQSRTLTLAMPCALFSMGLASFAQSADLTKKRADVPLRRVEELSSKLMARDAETESIRQQLQVLTEMVKTDTQPLATAPGLGWKSRQLLNSNLQTGGNRPCTSVLLKSQLPAVTE